MPWLTIIQIVWEILQLIFKWPRANRPALLGRLRLARQKAETHGDTSDLENMLVELSRHAAK